MNMKTVRGVVALALAAIAAAAFAQDTFPSRPVRIIVPAAPGGGADIAARVVGQKMSENLGQPVVVENRPGADTALATRYVKEQAPDGYTILLQAAGLTTIPALRLDPGFELKDFTPLGPINRTPAILLVSNESPFKSLRQLVDTVKAQPSKVSYATGGAGTPSHITTALFSQAAGNLKMLHVPYKGIAAATPDVLSGRVDIVFEGALSSQARVKQGQARALGITSSARLPGLPDVPTFAEQGMPSFNFYAWQGLLLPAGTPKPVVDRLAAALRSALTSKELADRFRAEGSETMMMTPPEFEAFLKAETAAMTKLIGTLGIQKQ